MNVGDICRRQITTVTRHTGLLAAAELMREKHVGLLVVIEPGMDPAAPVDKPTGRPVGVLTDRDIIVSVVAGGADPQQLTVADVMTREPVTVGVNASIQQALRTMRQIGIRRLPVVDMGGYLAGILALDDVIDLLASEILNVADAVRNERRIEDALRP